MPADFGEVYTHYWAYIFHTMLALTDNPEEAEDLASETFLRAWRAWDRYDPAVGRLGGWLRRIAENAYHDAGRRAGLWHALPPIDWGGAAPPTALDRMVGRETLMETLRLVARLSPQRRCIVRLTLQGCTQAEIGTALGISPLAVRSGLFQARARLTAAAAAAR